MRLRGSKPAPEALRAHDRHRPWVIAPVLAVLLLYCWCYTHLAAWLGCRRRPRCSTRWAFRAGGSSTATATSIRSFMFRSLRSSATTTSD
ncbi:hypothetical protein [Nannocystis pusilla]|uniref:hypothetical protein n=1 Tax=Nannocystis pusilla TaxID=889268 RepID=UPI003B761343